MQTQYKGKILAVFGDSIAYGSGNGGFGVGEYLERDLGFTLKKYAVGGARVGYKQGKNWMVDQVIGAIADFKESATSPDYVVFNGFTNDCYVPEDGSSSLPDVPLGEMSEGYEGFDIYNVSRQTPFSRCFEEIVCAFKTHFPKAALLFFRPHRMGRRDGVLQREYGERAIAICKKWGVEYADVYASGKMDTFDREISDKYTNDSYGWGRGDCTHPNALGYESVYMPIIESKIINLKVNA